MSPRWIAAGVALVALLALASESLFVVKQTQQGIVLQFGQVRAVRTEPGLYFKLPFVQNVVFYDRRVLASDPPPFEVLLTDKKRINVDAYARYKIVQPVIFFERARTVERFNRLFDRTVNASLRRVIATAAVRDVLSARRSDLMSVISDEVRRDAQTYGVEVVDVRIGRTDLPPETSQAVYGRMRTERERLAREARAQGEEVARSVRAEADKTRTVLLAEAERAAQLLRGEGESQRNRLLSAAYGRDAEFFRFFKSLEQYRQNLVDPESTLVISPDSVFFGYFNDPIVTDSELTE